MWRNIAKQASSRKLGLSLEPSSILPTYSFLGYSQNSNFPYRTRPVELKNCVNIGFLGRSFLRNGKLLPSCEDDLGRTSFGSFRNPTESYASVVEAISSTETEEDVSAIGEIQGLLEEMRKDEKPNSEPTPQRWPPKMVAGMGQGKYHMLRRRQVKIETKAWEQAAKEYKELLLDMCEQKP